MSIFCETPIFVTHFFVQMNFDPKIGFKKIGSKNVWAQWKKNGVKKNSSCNKYMVLKKFDSEKYVFEDMWNYLWSEKYLVPVNLYF